MECLFLRLGSRLLKRAVSLLRWQLFIGPGARLQDSVEDALFHVLSRLLRRTELFVHHVGKRELTPRGTKCHNRHNDSSRQQSKPRRSKPTWRIPESHHFADPGSEYV